MIDKLPLEIQTQIFSLVPRSNLRHTNRHFFTLYNDLFYEKVLKVFGPSIIPILIKILPWLKTFIQSLDAFRKESRQIIARQYKLTDENSDHPLDTTYVKDSWRYIYSVLRNRRLFAEYSDYTIDEPRNYVYNHYVEINRTYLLSYTKDVWLSPGKYNLSIGLIVKHGSGLGTTKFEVKYGDAESKTTATFYPPTNINEILPKQQFCMLKIGDFEVKGHGKAHTQKVTLVMEEIGLYLKSGFRIYFIDISQPSLLFNQYELLYYTIKETDFKYFINLPLKNLYKALTHVQNAAEYGSGDPNDIEYDYNYPSQEGHESSDLPPNNRLMNYAKFFYGRWHKREFKFLTIYQKRQFINRFGNFELDVDSKDGHTCTYDRAGLIWKIPLLEGL